MAQKKITAKTKGGEWLSTPKATLLKALSESKDVDDDLRVGGIVFIASSIQFDENGIDPKETSNNSITANTLVVATVADADNPLDPPFALATGASVVVDIKTVNAGAVTLDVNATGAKALQKNNAPLGAGELKAGSSYRITYDGAAYQMATNETIAAAKKTVSTAANDAAVAAAIAASTQRKFVAAQFDRTATIALADIPGLTVNLAANTTYQFEARISTATDATGGAKFAIGGTTTVARITVEAELNNAGAQVVPVTSRSTGAALGVAVGQATAVTVATVDIKGVITTGAAGGTLTVQFAQNVSVAPNSSVLVDSTFGAFKM